jgi:hypothetical protein
MTNLELSDDEAAILARELTDITWNDRYPLSPRIQTLKTILGKLRPEPARPAASPEPRVYAPPSRGRYGPRR